VDLEVLEAYVWALVVYAWLSSIALVLLGDLLIKLMRKVKELEKEVKKAGGAL